MKIILESRDVSDAVEDFVYKKMRFVAHKITVVEAVPDYSKGGPITYNVSILVEDEPESHPFMPKEGA